MATLAKITFSGRLPAGELFQYGLWVKHSDDSAITAAQAAAAGNAFQAELLTGTTPLAAQYTPSTVFNPPVGRTIDPSNGRTLDTAFGTDTHPGTASGTVFALPPGVAVCVTLRGNTGVKPIRGRFYLPAPYSGSLQGNGRMSSAAHVVFAGALANALDALESGTPFPQAVIYSPTHRAFYEVTRADVGDVFDSMRTRRDKLVEARSTILS